MFEIFADTYNPDAYNHVGANHSGRYFLIKSLNLAPECLAQIDINSQRTNICEYLLKFLFNQGDNLS
jgi:hypothetical protein